MNILYVTNTLHRGGAEAHLLLLAEGLQSRGAVCEVAYLRSIVSGGSIDLRDTFENARIKTHYLNCEKSYDLRSGLRLNRLLATRKWDILHSHLPRADAAAAMCKVFHSRQTWISTIHHPYDNAYSGARLMPAMAPMWKRADGVIAVSELVRQWSINRLGLPADRVRTITHGIEIDPGRRARTGRLESQGVESRFCVGSIGRYEGRKGHETLILAMVTVLKHFPNARLKIAGHDPWGYGDVLRKLIVDLNLEKHVELVGFITDKEQFFSEIDVFAFASRSEGFGIVVLEAMDAGIPAVVSNISPLNEIIIPGASGLVAEPENPRSFANAIVALFENREYMRRIAAGGQQRVTTEFSQERMVEKTLGFITTSSIAAPLRLSEMSGSRGVNYDSKVLDGFGEEWSRFDQRAMGEAEARALFERYFAIFPWAALTPQAVGFDAGCGSGRWARFVAPRVGRLHCVDGSPDALDVARANLATNANCEFHLSTIDSMPLPDGALDFGYSLGVLHHIPDTPSALNACVRKLKPRAPFLLYLYYAFDNRPAWFRMIWKASDRLRAVLSRCPFRLRSAICDLLAGVIYLPLARAARLAERTGMSVENFPLSAYRDRSFYVMRTDALDRFGTRLEKRFTREEIRRMMEEAGLTDVRFHDGPPFWVAVGVKAARP